MSFQDKGLPRAPQDVEQFVKQLNITYKAVRLYPVTSAIPRQGAGEAVSVLKGYLERNPVMLLQVTKEGLFHEGAQVFPASAAFVAFAREFYARNLAEVRFHAGVTDGDIAQFLQLLDIPPHDILQQGGFEAALWESGVSNISVAETTTRIVETTDEIADERPEVVEGESWPPTRGRLDELIDSAASGHARDQRVLVRALRDPMIVADYLTEALTPQGSVSEEVDLASRIGALARCMQFELPEERAALIRSVADAVLSLEDGARTKLLRSRLLEDARRDDSVADVVREMGLDAVLESILDGMEETPEVLAGLMRAIRNLAIINVAASKDALFDAAGEKMQLAGASQGFITSVLEGAAPHKLTVQERTRSDGAQPVDSILRLIDMTPDGAGHFAYDDAIAPLRAEAARGTTDGDVVAALVTIATIERRPEAFASVMSLLENSISLLIDQHEFEVAADAAEALIAALESGDLEGAQQTRVRQIVESLTAPLTLKKVTAALRLYRHDSLEHASCRRLLSVLGESTIDSLLEVLADEPDMAARKAVVDLVSSMAARYVPQLGARVSDRRWYFVRNVVAILSATRSKDVLPYLQRTLRHADARVRRETIRGLASIHDSLSDALLVSALSDDDAPNVQLAARYLGSLNCAGAAAALEEVARGAGKGNRENGPRIEAIEALGTIGAPSSIAALRELARRRGILGGRDRDVRTAAEAALASFGARSNDGGLAT